MNWQRIVAGGLLAGLVLNLGEFAVEPLMGPQMEQFFERLSLPVPGEAVMIGLAGVAFAVGVTSVWLYAAIRPRYGAGARTAALAGVAVWALSCLFPNLIMLGFGLFTPRLFWFYSALPLVTTVLATCAGAAVYRERALPGLQPAPSMS